MKSDSYSILESKLNKSEIRRNFRGLVDTGTTMIYGPEYVILLLIAKQQNLTFDKINGAYYYTDVNLDPNSLAGKFIEYDWFLIRIRIILYLKYMRKT